MRVSVKADEWWWGGTAADGQEVPFGRVAHRRNLATSRSVNRGPAEIVLEVDLESMPYWRKIIN
jgi:hypothetical protein